MNRIEQKGPFKNKGWFRRILGLSTILIFGGMVFILLLGVFLFPGIMQQEVKRRLGELTEGPVHIKHVQASYTGRIVIKGLQFSDEENRSWFNAEQMTIFLAKWPSFHPVIDVIEIDGLNVRLSVADGKLVLPAIHWPETSKSRDRTSGLSKFSINRAAVTLAYTLGEETVYKDVTLSVTEKTNGEYEFMLKRIPGEGSEVFTAGGDINSQSAEFDVSLKIEHHFTKTEMSLALVALNVPEVSAEGRVDAHLRVAGNLNKPSGIRSSGNVEWSQGIFFFQDMVLAGDLMCKAQIDGQRLDVNEFTAMMCDGPINGKFHAEIKDERFIEYRGQVRAKNVNYPEFTSVLTANAKKVTDGSFSGNYDFSGLHDSKSLHGEGLILMNDIDVSVLPVIPTVFQFLGLSRFEPLKMSDAEAKFHNVGPLVTIESGHVSNLFAAIEFESGGTIDLDTEQVDGYVVAAPLSQITGVIERLPIINIFAHLKDKLTRLRVKGHWSDPPRKLIKKEPLQDLKESTLGFIRDVARTGGHFGQGMIDGLNNLLEMNHKKK